MVPKRIRRSGAAAATAQAEAPAISAAVVTGSG
jgi:hypothetical protein